MDNTKDTPMVKSTESERTDLIIRSLKLEIQKQKEEFSNVRTLLNNMNKQLMDDLVKQKELNAELSKGLENAVDWVKKEFPEKFNSVMKEIESLIKKSNEI